MPTHFASSGAPPARRGRPRAYDVRELLTVGLGSPIGFIFHMFLDYAKKRHRYVSIGDRLCILLLYLRVYRDVCTIIIYRHTRYIIRVYIILLCVYISVSGGGLVDNYY